MKKILKIVGITLAIIIVTLFVTPWLFQSQIQEIVKQFINENVNAKVEFSDINLSLLSSFPKAKVSVHDLLITTYNPFENDTLVNAKSLSFEMPIKELFKKPSDGALVINTIALNNAALQLKTNVNGDVNYDIAKPSNSQENTRTQTQGSFSFDVKNYSINNSAFSYSNESSKTKIHFYELNHTGYGTFSENISELDTKTEAKISISIDTTSYLKNNSIKLDALIGLDLENNTYIFKDNEGFINQLPIEFDGYVKLIDEGQDINITFNNSGSSFKDLLAIIPEAYSKNLEDVETSGDFKAKGELNGLLTETTIPKFNISLVSTNASFKYPNLPKKVENININASLKNDDGNLKNTYVSINTLDFKIDNDVFKSSATLKNLTKNIQVNAVIDGVLNLANISKAYPIVLEKNISGILKGNLTTSFDVNALETNAYERIKSSGNLNVSDFKYSSEDIVNPIYISEANMTFKTSLVVLNNFNAKTGTSDFNATGTIHNLLGYLLSDGKLQGNFNMNSNSFAISDFMVENKNASNPNISTKENESLKIPAFLDCTINANAKTVLYDNLTLNNVKGQLIIKNEEAILKNMTSSIFDGNLSISGLVNTTQKTPSFNMILGASNFDISQSFSQLELLQNLAPIAKALKGKLNTEIELKGTLDQEFNPNLNSLSGNALAELLTTKIQPENTPLLNALGNSISFIDFKKIDLKNLKTKLSFENGEVSMKPFKLKYQDIDITIEGAHSFDKSLSYNALFNVPAKYLGNDINKLINKINDDAVKNITIPVTANIGGTFMAPTVKTDLTSGVTTLTKQLIEIQKQKLIKDGTTKVKDLIGDIINKNKKTNKDSSAVKTDTTKTTLPNNNIENEVKNVLGNLFKKKQTKKDTIN